VSKFPIIQSSHASGSIPSEAVVDIGAAINDCNLLCDDHDHQVGDLAAVINNDPGISSFC